MNNTIKTKRLKALEISLLLFITIWFIPNSIFAQGYYGYPYNYGFSQPPPYWIQNNPYNYVAGGNYYYYPDDAAYLLLNYGYDVYNPPYWVQNNPYNYVAEGNYYYYPDDAAYLLLNYGYDVYNPS